MALNNCKECGNKVSSKAKACPSCGAPTKNSPFTLTAILIAVAILIIIIFLKIDSSGSDSTNEKQSGFSSQNNLNEDSEMQDNDKNIEKAEIVQPQPLEIKALKIYQTSKSHAAMDIRFTNSSSNNIQHWSVNVEVYDSKGKYLARGEGMVSHIASGQSKVQEILLLDTKASQISQWEASLGGVVGSSGLREDTKYKLTIVE